MLGFERQRPERSERQWQCPAGDADDHDRAAARTPSPRPAPSWHRCPRSRGPAGSRGRRASCARRRAVASPGGSEREPLAWPTRSEFVRGERLRVDRPDARCHAGADVRRRVLMARLVGVAAIWGRAARGLRTAVRIDQVIVAATDLDAASARLEGEHGLALPGPGGTRAWAPITGPFRWAAATWRSRGGRRRGGSAVSARAGAGRPHGADRRGTDGVGCCL